MLDKEKLQQYRKQAGLTVGQLAEKIERPGLDNPSSAIRNWERGLMTPRPTAADLDHLAAALQISKNDLQIWRASHKYAPIAPRKVRLVADLIRGKSAQDAMDILKFANKRAAVYVDQVLKSAVASADEQEADVDRLYVSEARVDGGGVRRGTRRWRPKDRGRAFSFTRLASHIHIGVNME